MRRLKNPMNGQGGSRQGFRDPQVVGEIASVTADAAYDTVAIYDVANVRGARVVIPPTRKAKVAQRGPRSAERDRTKEKAEEIGRGQWQKDSGYHRQGRVENTMFRYKGIVGDRLRARHSKAQGVKVAFDALQPESIADMTIR